MLRIRGIILTMLAGVFFTAQSCAAQQCNNAIPSHTPESRLSVQTDGTVLDQRTHLVWMRCSVGQHWSQDKNTCMGNAQPLTWSQAQQFANQYSMDNGWRLPTVHELSAIVELRCFNPAIDLGVFPQTAPTHFWSATPFSNKSGHYWLIQFLNGENHTDSEKRLAFVRLVKTASADPR